MPRSFQLARPLFIWCGLFAAALAFAVPGQSKQDPFLAGRVSTVPTVTLRNGTGDGTAEAHVDPTGFFGASTGGLNFDPVGALGPSETTFYSGLWFSGSNRAGQAGGTFLGLNSTINAQFSTVTETRAVSSFTLEGVEFTVVQELLPASETGTTLRQTYTMKNVGFPADTQSSVVNFDLLRHFDGDLTFDESIDDVAVRAPGGQQLYELDSNDDPDAPTTFVGIDMNGQANLGNRIAEFSFTSDIFQQGRGVLNGTITRDGTSGSNTENADLNNDGVTDGPYDVTLTLGRTFQVPFGQRATLITNTVLGAGAPTDLFKAPSNLTATRQSGNKALLRWQDNSNNERGFEIQRRIDDGDFVRRGSTDANVTQFVDKKVKENTLYSYRVRALRSEGPTEFSNETLLDTSGGGGESLPPRFIDPSPRDGTRFRVDPGEKVQFTVRAEDPDTSQVLLSADSIPAGAIASPTLPVTGNPAEATFSWTPTEKDKGIYDLTFSAHSDDGNGSTLVETVQYRILVGRAGVCVNGDVGHNKALRVDGLAGYPKGGKKFIGKLTMKLKNGNQTFKASEITRLALVGNTVTMEGLGTVNGRGSHQFVLQAEDNGPTPRDRMLVVTVDGASWPSGPMRSGAGVLQHLP